MKKIETGEERGQTRGGTWREKRKEIGSLEAFAFALGGGEKEGLEDGRPGKKQRWKKGLRGGGRGVSVMR